jgi:hypothetical protein
VLIYKKILVTSQIFISNYFDCPNKEVSTGNDESSSLEIIITLEKQANKKKYI